MAAQRPYQRHLRSTSTLPARHQEIAVLRMGWRCGSEYVLAQHEVIGARSGLEQAEVRRLREEATDRGWDRAERAVIDVVDELHATHGLADATWDRLRAHFDDAQCLELMSVIGRYWTVSVIANALRVPLERAVEGTGEGDAT
jgi:alkylhydroperoxidase family enzyme